MTSLQFISPLPFFVVMCISAIMGWTNATIVLASVFLGALIMNCSQEILRKVESQSSHGMEHQSLKTDFFEKSSLDHPPQEGE